VLKLKYLDISHVVCHTVAHRQRGDWHVLENEHSVSRFSMASSGLLNSVQYDVTSLLELASRRCGVLPGRLTSEEILLAQQELQFIINTLINDGIPLWTITKQIYGLAVNQITVPLSNGAVDLINVLYRFTSLTLPSGGIAASSAGGNAQNAFSQQLGVACTQTSANGNISYQFSTSTVVTTVGMLMNSTQTLNPVYEYSNDGANWFTAVPAASAPSIFIAGQWYWQDVPSPQLGLYFRVRETSGGTLDAAQLAFNTQSTEILISRTNRDDYQNLPNKSFIGRVLQYWLDRQINPQIWLWPASYQWLDCLVSWQRMEIQDVGTFQNSLSFPARWLDYVVWDLASRMSMIVPGVDPQRMPVLAAMATTAKMRAWTEERDASPVMLSPRIGCYTRGT
jgi:hypothetical protein